MYDSLRPSVSILYEDDDLLVLSKPDGVLSHPNPQAKTPKEEKAVFRAPYDFKQEAFLLPEPLYLLHRLDRDTSGVILCAKNENVAKIIKDHFENRKVRKEYVALLLGTLHPKKGEWKDQLEKGGNAETHYEVTRGYPDAPATLVRFHPRTGKTHQLRIQSQRHHHPILGDRMYGDFRRNKEFAKLFHLKRLFLHASSIEIFHPGLGKKMLFSSPLPDKLAQVLEVL